MILYLTEYLARSMQVHHKGSTMTIIYLYEQTARRCTSPSNL